MPGLRSRWGRALAAAAPLWGDLSGTGLAEPPDPGPDRHCPRFVVFCSPSFEGSDRSSRGRAETVWSALSSATSVFARQSRDAPLQVEGLTRLDAATPSFLDKTVVLEALLIGHEEAAVHRQAHDSDGEPRWLPTNV